MNDSHFFVIISLCPFFFNDTATTEIYTLSLHDALPISVCGMSLERRIPPGVARALGYTANVGRSEEHTSELQSRRDLVCRLLLEKKKSSIPPTNSTSMPKRVASVSPTVMMLALHNCLRH